MKNELKDLEKKIKEFSDMTNEINDKVDRGGRVGGKITALAALIGGVIAAVLVVLTNF